MMRLWLLAILAIGLVPGAVAAKETADLMIKNATVLTLDAQRTDYENGVLVVRGERIEAVGGADLADAYEAARVIDAKGGIVLPGMINLHNHIPMVAFRGLAESGIESVEDRLFNWFFPLEGALLSRELIRVSARQAALELALGGVTTVVDMYYHEDEVARSVVEVGLRGVLGETVINFPVVDAPEPYGGLQYAEGFIEEWNDHPLITPAIATHAPYTVSPEKLMEAKALAERTGAPILIHMAEFASEREMIASNFEGTTQERSVTRYLDDIGFLGPDVVGAHVIYVDEADIAILKARGVGISHNPKANTKDMSGLPPAWSMYKGGLKIGLGTDGPMSSNQMDIFSVMQYAARVARIDHNDPTKFEPRELVEMATLGGARALGRTQDLGSLEVGKLADFILVETQSPNMQPVYDPYAVLAFQAYAANVVLSVVHGRIIAEDGVVVGVDLESHAAEWKKVTRDVAAFAQTLE